MNGEQLKKINELVEEKEKVKWCISEGVMFENIGLTNRVYLPNHIAKIALTAYLDELKAELKELGYEE